MERPLRSLTNEKAITLKSKWDTEEGKKLDSIPEKEREKGDEKREEEKSPHSLQEQQWKAVRRSSSSSEACDIPILSLALIKGRLWGAERSFHAFKHTRTRERERTLLLLLLLGVNRYPLLTFSSRWARPEGKLPSLDFETKKFFKASE